MIRRLRDAALLNVGVAVGHHMLILAARLLQAWHGTRKVPPRQQAAAVRYFRSQP